jgi:hypothetical protein
MELNELSAKVGNAASKVYNELGPERPDDI